MMRKSLAFTLITATLLPGAAAFSQTAAAPAAQATANAIADEPNVCASEPRGPQAKDIAAICQSGRDWIAHFSAGDIDGLMSLYAADAQVALHGQHKLRGRDSVRAFFGPALAAKPKVQFLLHVEDIRVHGDMAYLISRYWYTSDSQDGKHYEDAGRSLLVYHRERSQRRAGDWKIVVDIDQASPDVSFPPPASAR